MPGIAGIIATEPAPEYGCRVQRMLASMIHLPGRETGTVFAPELGVYAGWVAHPGSFAAQLSHSSAHSGGRLLLAGECFDDGDAAGGSTAVRIQALLKCIDDDPDTTVAGLNGLFSGIFIDPRRRQTLLFNDRYGSERLFTHAKDGATYFASEAKALLRVLPELRAFDEIGVAEFLSFGSTLDGRTLFHGLRAIAGGSLWRYRRGSAPIHACYFKPGEWETRPALDAVTYQSRLTERLVQALPAHLKADTAVGLSLTAGLDTRMIAACLPKSSKAPMAYTYAALKGETLDVRIARQVAELCGLEHRVLRIGSDFLTNYGREVDRTVYITDGCAGARVAHEIYLSRQARQVAPVRLTGNFGSEVLRGMSTFKPEGLETSLFEASLVKEMDEAESRVRSRRVHPVTHAAFEEVPWHLYGPLAAARSQMTVRTPYLDNEIVALAYRAPGGLHSTPEPALRLIASRHPALALLPTDRGLTWPGQGLRSFARRAWGETTFKLDYLHKEGLPNSLSRLDPAFGPLAQLGLLGLHKFLPYRRWYRNELASYLAEVLGDAQTRRMPFWNASALGMLLSDHVAGRRNRMREISAVLTLESVQRLLVSDAAHEMPAQSAAHSHAREPVADSLWTS